VSFVGFLIKIFINMLERVIEILVRFLALFIPGSNNRKNFRRIVLKNIKTFGRLVFLNISVYDMAVVKMYIKLYTIFAFLKKKKISYDIIIPVGVRCYTSSLLRCLGLQVESFPFDWIFHSKLETALSTTLDLLSNKDKFEKWFELEDLEYMASDKPLLPNDSHRSRRVINKKTGLLYIHDFTWDNSLEEEYQKNKEKYDRRRERVLRYINQASSVLFVYIGDMYDQVFESKEISDKAIVESMAKIRAKYGEIGGGGGKCSDRNVFSNDETKKKMEIERVELDKGVVRIKSNHKIKTKGKFGVVYSIYRVLSEIELSDRFYNHKKL
jgi:hypothetical protein